MNQIFTLVACLVFCLAGAQSPWPSVSWAVADNLTAVMDADGLNDLSGLHWNPVNNRLYCVQNDGHLHVLQMDGSSMGFTQIVSKTLSGGPEGITQVDFSANEFYVIDENSYEIRKYTHSSNFGSLTLSRHWDLLAAPSPMEDTGNTGPEGIAFVPDAALSAAGFISQQTGNLYTSTKGMGGLMFIAHQDEGFVWVFDVNPTVNDDFAYVGKYETNRSESCDLAFDRTTGMLYILHNTGDNYLETTNLSTEITSGASRKFVTANEYFVATAEGNVNIEGFALMPKCPESNTQGAWLCRDASNGDESEILQDVLRWFSPFAADGSCQPLGIAQTDIEVLGIYPNPGNNLLTISFNGMITTDVVITNALGQRVMTQQITGNSTIDVAHLAPGLYFVTVRIGDTLTMQEWIKQ
jgi:hypothetical protein